jgi:hypothetical protein
VSSYEVVVCSEAFNDLLCGFFVFEASHNFVSFPNRSVNRLHITFCVTTILGENEHSK